MLSITPPPDVFARFFMPLISMLADALFFFRFTPPTMLLRYAMLMPALRHTLIYARMRAAMLPDARRCCYATYVTP